MKISDLISTITPLYNNYKSNKSNLTATESIIVMWDIGYFIDEYIKIHNVSPHNLYREIYGKSESGKNIAQKSYITREFLSRCFRIYKMFKTKNEVKLKFPTLGDFSSFREAMPFFDNPIYKLSEINEIDLIKFLNSNQKSSDIVKVLDKKKKSINNILNPRDQKLNQLNDQVKLFKTFYNYIFKNIRDLNYDACIIELMLDKEGLEKINILTKNLSSLAQEGKAKYIMNDFNFQNVLLNQFYILINELIRPNDEKVRRRFRRLIPPERIIKISDYIFSILTVENYYQIKNKIGI